MSNAGDFSFSMSTKLWLTQKVMPVVEKTLSPTGSQNCRSLVCTHLSIEELNLHKVREGFFTFIVFLLSALCVPFFNWQSGSS